MKDASKEHEVKDDTAEPDDEDIKDDISNEVVEEKLRKKEMKSEKKDDKEVKKLEDEKQHKNSKKNEDVTVIGPEVMKNSDVVKKDETGEDDHNIPDDDY